MKNRMGIIFIAVSFLPSLLSADVNNRQNMAPQMNHHDNRYQHPAYQQHFNNRQRPAMQRPMSQADMQKMREQHQQRMAEQRQWMQQQRPVPSAQMLAMQQQHQQRMAMMHERMQQMRAPHQQPNSKGCGPQNRVQNPTMRPMVQSGYPGPRISSAYPNRMNMPQRPAYRRSAQSSYRGYPLPSQWNQNPGQFNQQAPRRFSQPNYHRPPSMMPSYNHMSAQNHRLYSQRMRNYLPNQDQRYRNWNRSRNNHAPHYMPPVAYLPEARRPLWQQQSWRSMPVRYPYQSIQMNKAVYAR